MTQDNYSLIRPLLDFDQKQENFYFLQILQRKKDAQKGQKVNGTNNNSRLVKAYYISNMEYFDFIEKEVKLLCEVFNARAGINLNKRNYEKVALRNLKLVTDNLINKNFDKVYKTYSSASGKYSDDSNKKWIIDVDSDELHLVDDIIKSINLIQPYDDLRPNKVYTKIPSRTGLHIITSPFNLAEFKENFPQIDVQKNNPTNLYIP